MSECAFARVYAAVFACAVVSGLSPANAQEATQQNLPAETPPPATGEAALPEIVVKSPPEQKAAPKAKKKSSGQAKSGGAAAGTPDTPPSDPNAAKLETATGPVKGYAATRTATGIKTDTPLKEIPQSISVVGQEQIRDQGAQTLQDTLRYVPGVVADAYGLDSRTDSTIIRGTEAAEYLDGLRRTFNYYIYNYRLDPYFLERVEVLRGPPSVLYGQAPVGGIINSVSKRPQEEQYGEVTVEYGTFDFKQVKTDVTGPLTSDGKWLYRITGSARDADTQVDYVEDDRLALQPSITYRPVSGTSVTLLGHFQKDHTGSTAQFLPHIGTLFPNVNGNRISQDRFVGEPDDRYDTDVASGTLLAEHKINQTFKIQHSMRYSDIHNDYRTTYPGFFAEQLTFPDVPYLTPAQDTFDRIKSISIADTQVFNSDTNLEAKFDTGIVRHKVLGGMDYADFQAQSSYGDALNMTPFNVYNPQYGQPENLVGFECGASTPTFGLPDVAVCRSPDQHVTQTGIYIQDQLRLGNWIGIVGGRYDWLKNGSEGSAPQKDEAFTYRAGLMYEFASGFTPYVSYAQSFVPVVAPTFDGSPLDPQRGEMTEIGLKYQPSGSNFAINSAVYDITEYNRVSDDPKHIGFSIQSGEVSIRGFEIEARGSITSNLKAIATYSYTDAKYVVGNPHPRTDESQNGKRIESVPEHLASMWLIYTFDEGMLNGWSIGAGVRYIGASWDGYDRIETPDVTLFDAMLAYDTRDWRWQLTAQNLEDEEYLTTCLARGDCFVGAARTVKTGLTYKF